MTVDCETRWVEDDETKQHGWDLFRDTPPPLGRGDLAAHQPERIAHLLFHLLRLTPWRVQVLRAEQLAAGDFSPRTWRAAPSTTRRRPSSTA